ncbi:GH25243, partial [Drosophila grimshawi]
DSTEPNLAVAVATDNTTITIAEQPQAAGNNNVAIELALVEPEAEYVLVDAGTGLELELTSPTTHDELQLGSFTHIDSDFHLQPVVHSVEIVPTSLDDPLIVNYVHNLR